MFLGDGSARNITSRAITMSCLEIAARRESRRMHKHEVTAIIDMTETSVARIPAKARPPLGTIDLCPSEFFTP